MHNRYDVYKIKKNKIKTTIPIKKIKWFIYYLNKYNINSRSLKYNNKMKINNYN